MFRYGGGISCFNEFNPFVCRDKTTIYATYQVIICVARHQIQFQNKLLDNTPLLSSLPLIHSSPGLKAPGFPALFFKPKMILLYSTLKNFRSHYT